MYKIKGHDQNEYGPVDAAQLRQWIAEGRVDAQTLLRLEGTADWKSLGSFPEFVMAAPPPPLRPTTAPPLDNTIATLIPYKNAPALIAYYLGIFSLIPCVGSVLGVAAFILGIIGLKRFRQYPESGGKVHAWIGIIIGGIVVLAHLMLLIIILAARSRNR